MNNIEKYKKRFYTLMESTIGNVKPLVLEDTESAPKETEGESTGPIIEPESSAVDFDDMTIKVIKNLEGGYYNPKWHYASEMLDSGETMFGLDRKHGGDTVVNSAAGKQFWGLIDKNKTKEVWKRYYRGGNLEDQLTRLAAQVMKPVFERNMNDNFNEEEKKIIFGHKGLLFHFIYASWNGQGWFQKFAKFLKEKIKQGITSPSVLFDQSIQKRKDSSSAIIKKGGRQIDSMRSQLGL